MYLYQKAEICLFVDSIIRSYALLGEPRKQLACHKTLLPHFENTVSTNIRLVRSLIVIEIEFF